MELYFPQKTVRFIYIFANLFNVYHKIAGLFAFISCDVLTEEYLKKIRYVVKKGDNYEYFS